MTERGVHTGEFSLAGGCAFEGGWGHDTVSCPDGWGGN